MKIAIIHLSDFHIKEDDAFSKEKISKLIESLNVLNRVDKYIIVFSGDLAFSGQKAEYEHSRNIFSNIISGIKKINDSFIKLIIVPGNHDLCLPPSSRNAMDIQKYYDDNVIQNKLEEEFGYLDNFYAYSSIRHHAVQNKLFEKIFEIAGGYKIQFNIINTAPFSTLAPDDKELHYFPNENLNLLNRDENASICISVMHHNYEWFNWKYKDKLANKIIDNSDVIMYGHDHSNTIASVKVNDLDLLISDAGEMHFDDIDKQDSYNILVLDSSNNNYTAYTFVWDTSKYIYSHTKKSGNIDRCSNSIRPIPSYIKGLKEDEFTASNDFTKYYVFPQLASEYKDENDKPVKVETSEELFKILKEKNKLLIVGDSSSGKSLLLNKIYIDLLDTNITPLLFRIDYGVGFKPNDLFRTLFEEQYGEDSIVFEKYQQLSKKKKVLLVDNLDFLKIGKNIEELLSQINDEFDYVIFTSSVIVEGVVDIIREKITSNHPIYQLRIKPFFAKKRRELLEKVFLSKGSDNENLNKIDMIVGNIIKNDNNVFMLNPAFLVKYAMHYSEVSTYDYANSEKIFTTVFAIDLINSIRYLVDKKDIDEFLTTYEEIAGYMFNEHKESLNSCEVSSIISQYNDLYGVKMDTNKIINVGKQSKLFVDIDDNSIKFRNKNQLAYFIARYLIRMNQSTCNDGSGIFYALKNICFGINMDIVLFISYLSSNTQLIMEILSQAKELLSPWQALVLGKNSNLPLLTASTDAKITPPSSKDKTSYNDSKEMSEEIVYLNNEVKAEGLFDYDDAKIDEFQYRISRSIKYTELLCRALTMFNSTLKKDEKKEIIDAIYQYTRKISYALLKPIDENVDEICEGLFEEENNNKDIIKKLYSKDDIRMMLISFIRAIYLSMSDHFAEMCTSNKTFDLLAQKQIDDDCILIQRLIVYENYGNTDMLVKEAESILNDNHNYVIKTMTKLVVRKHILTSPELSFSKQQQIVDKIFGEKMRKDFLIEKNKS